jgi:hypothetical protein
MQVQTVRDAHAALPPLSAESLAPVAAFEAAGKQHHNLHRSRMRPIIIYEDDLTLSPQLALALAYNHPNFPHLSFFHQRQKSE